MKSLMCAAALMVMLAILPGCAGTRPAPATTPAVSQVDQLFARMEAGQYSEEIRFPNLTWADIPALLQRTNSTRMLTTFPTNPLSSERQAQCSEGMVALWLVEGIRKTPKPEFASLNPLVLPPGPQNGKDWGAISEQNHAKAAAAYQKWWTEAGSVSEEKARQSDPLQSPVVSGISWY